MQFTPISTIVLHSITYVLILVIFFTRIWILRAQRRTRSFQITTFFHAVSTVVFLAAISIMTAYSVRELQLTKEYRGDEAEVAMHLFTSDVLKVCGYSTYGGLL